MRVRFFANLRDLTGCAETDIPHEETAGTLARSLCARYGDKLRQKIFPPGDPGGKEEKFNPEIIFLVNGRHISHLGGFAAPLKPDDRVDIFPLVAGG